MPTLVEDLNTVPWAELSHAYGSATDTPDHLAALLSNDASERAQARNALWASVCHQGTVYEASCAAVPFLIRILREGPADVRPGVLSLLAGLASRRAYANRNVCTLFIETEYFLATSDTERRQHARHTLWRPSEFLVRGNRYQDVRWLTRAHELALEGLDVYVALLDARDENGNPDQRTAQAALYLLAGFPEAEETVVPAFEARLVDNVRDGGDIFVAEALLSLGALLADDSSRWERHLSAVATEHGAQRRSLVRYAAAAALARYRPEATPADAVALLVEAVVEPQRLDERHKLLCGSGHDESVHVEACQLLSRLPSPQSVDALIAALDRGAERWRVLDTVRVAEALLDTAFFGGWVQGRLWSHTTQEMKFGDEQPYEERSYHSYGHSYWGGKPFTLEIESVGYVEEEAERLRERWTNAEVERFTADQQRAVEAVLRCAPLWSVNHHLFDIYGLPSERDALEALLSVE